MLKLEEIKQHAQVRGIRPDEVVQIVAAVPVGTDALTVYFKDNQGAVQEQMLFRDEEPKLSLAEAGRPWAFDAPGDDFKLGLEAYRISQAALFDPMMTATPHNGKEEAQAWGTCFSEMPSRTLYYDDGRPL